MTRRLLIATPLYPPEIGGPATYTKILESQLPKHGIDVEVIKFGGVHHLPRGVRHVAYFWKVFSALEQCDAVLALDPVSVGFPAYIASRVLLKPLYVKVVGDYAWEQFQIKNSKGKSKNFVTPEEFQKNRYDFLTELRRWIEHHVAKNARRVIVPSEYLKKIVCTWGLREEKISVIYNAFEPPVLEESREALRKKFGWLKKIILSAGRDVPWKGFEMLRNVIGEIPGAELFIANNLPHEELLLRIKAADMFVLNTGYEGLSHLLLEVMSLGTPIITTRVGGNTELIEDRTSGLLIPFNNEKALRENITTLLEKPDYASGLAKKAEEKVREFSIDRMVGDLLRTLEQ